LQSQGRKLPRHARTALGGLFAAVFLAACGGGGTSAPTAQVAAPAPAPGTAPAPAPGPAPAPAPAVAVKTSYTLLKDSGLVPQKTRSANDNARTYLDVDGDGVLETFAVQMLYDPATSTPATAPLARFGFYRKQPDGSLREDTSLLPAGNRACVHPRKAVLSDFNGDGKLDIFVACHGYDAAPFPGEKSKVVLSQPNGTYLIQDANTEVGFFHSAAAADFNGDGIPDVVVANSQANPSIKVWLNNGQGQFTPTTDYVPNELRRQANFFTVDVPDVDGDGKFDLFVGGHEWENAKPTVYVNPGNNNFTSVTGTVLPAVANEGVVLDIAVTGTGVDRAAWLLRTSGGDGTFYQSLVVQKVRWPSLASTVAAYKRPQQWQAWMIPAVINGTPKLVSDDVDVASIDIAYGPAADKYAGTWNMACSGSETETFTLTKTDATHLTGQVVQKSYGNPSCTGAPTSTQTFNATISIDGQVTVMKSGLPVSLDQVTANVDSGIGIIKWMATVLPNGQLFVDFDDAGVSSSTAYPSDQTEGYNTYDKQ
jgi:hypothetical protein